jgi:hypothetical protein
MKGLVIVSVEARRSPPNIFGIAGPKMGKVWVGIPVQWTETTRGWVRVEFNKWIPAWAVRIVEDIPTPPVIIPTDGNIRKVRWHSEMPDELQNRGSFGIVRVYAHAKADKPHSLYPEDYQLQHIFDMNSQAAVRWMVGENNTKDPMARIDGVYSIPTQGVYMGNFVKVLREENGFSEIEGMSVIPPAVECSPFSHPESWHFMYCVGRKGQTINPPCGVAFFPVINPRGWKGGTVGGDAQTEIWIESKWLKET